MRKHLFSPSTWDTQCFNFSLGWGRRSQSTCSFQARVVQLQRACVQLKYLIRFLWPQMNRHRWTQKRRALMWGWMGYPKATTFTPVPCLWSGSGSHPYLPSWLNGIWGAWVVVCWLFFILPLSKKSVCSSVRCFLYDSFISLQDRLHFPARDGVSRVLGSHLLGPDSQLGCSGSKHPSFPIYKWSMLLPLIDVWKGLQLPGRMKPVWRFKRSCTAVWGTKTSLSSPSSLYCFLSFSPR